MRDVWAARVGVVVIVLLTAFAAAPAAQASRAEAVEIPSPFGHPPGSMTFSEVRYFGQGPEGNHLVVDVNGPQVTFADPLVRIQAGQNCTSLAPNAARCAVPTCTFEPCFISSYLVRVVLKLGDNADSVTPAPTTCTSLTGCLPPTSTAAMVIDAGGAADTIQGGRGGPDFYDQVNAGSGNDHVIQGPGHMDVICGPGTDVVVVNAANPATVAADCEVVIPA